MTDLSPSERLTKTSLAQKIRWEGGVLAALDYGIKPDEIEDAQLATLWRELDEAYRRFSPLLEEVAERLDVAA